MKTGHFPGDDTHDLVLSMLDSSRRRITVIPPATPPAEAARLLRAAADPGPPMPS